LLCIATQSAPQHVKEIQPPPPAPYHHDQLRRQITVTIHYDTQYCCNNKTTNKERPRRQERDHVDKKDHVVMVEGGR
jgi:hypothetical protein